MLIVMMAATTTNIRSIPIQGSGAFWLFPGGGGGSGPAGVAAPRTVVAASQAVNKAPVMVRRRIMIE